MNPAKRFIFVLVLFGWQSLLSMSICDIIRLSDVGYYRRFWDTEVVKVNIKCINGQIECQIECKKGNIENKSSQSISLKSYLELWDYIYTNNILFLKSGAVINGSLTDAEFEELYGKKFPRQYSYWYDFYFKIGNESYTFTVEDIGYIKDMRYLEILSRINKLINVKTEINKFGDTSKQ